MRKFTLFVLFVSFISIFGWVHSVQAGFGVSPPGVTNDHLVPGSHFEKTIYLIRGQPNVDMKAQVSIDAPGIEDWIKIDKGLSFLLPKGEQKVPMTVIIDVPSGADFGDYGGYIRVQAIPSGGEEGQVAMVLGVRIDVDLAVVQEEFSDFKLSVINVPNFEQGSPLVVLVNLENLGNVKIRPSKVHLDIYDIGYKNILASGDITEMSWIEPFKIAVSEGGWQNELGLGEYWAAVTVFKGEESVGPSKIHFQVVPKGTLKKPEILVNVKEDKGFSYLYLGIGIGVISLVVLILLIWLDWKRKREIPKVFQEKKPKRVSRKRK